MKVAIGERVGVRRKPAQASVLEALRLLGSGVEGAIYAGDSDAVSYTHLPTQIFRLKFYLQCSFLKCCAKPYVLHGKGLPIKIGEVLSLIHILCIVHPDFCRYPRAVDPV